MLIFKTTKLCILNPIEIRPNRFGYLIPIPFCLLLMWLVYKYVLIDPQQPIEDEMFFYIAYGIMIIGGFLALNFAWRFIKAPVVFRMDDQGILYNPAGVTTGLIRWDEIADANEKNIKVVRNDAPVYQTVLALKLKDPEAFRKRHNLVLAHLLKLGNKMYDADVLLEISVLGKKYDAVKEELRKRVPLSFMN